jgi:hypothetical protein
MKTESKGAARGKPAPYSKQKGKDKRGPEDGPRFACGEDRAQNYLMVTSLPDLPDA